MSPKGERRRPVAFVGPGAAGSALARALLNSGWPVGGFVARTVRQADEAALRWGGRGLGTPEAPGDLGGADTVVLSVRDPELAVVATQLASSGTSWAERVVLHLSGSVSSDALDPLRARGAHAASFHPLMTFPRGSDRDWPADTPFVVEGDDAAIVRCRSLAAALGGEVALLAPAMRPLYHAGATMAGNLLVAVLAAAEEVLAASGLSDARRLVEPLARETVAAFCRDSGKAATGPVARGDLGTIERHLRALEDSGISADARRVHALLSLRLVALAREAGGHDEALDAIEQRFREALHELPPTPRGDRVTPPHLD